MTLRRHIGVAGLAIAIWAGRGGAQVDKREVIQQAHPRQEAAQPVQQSSAPQLGPPKPQEDPAERLPTTRPTERVPLPSDDLVNAERRKIWAEFRADYDAHGPGERGPLAHQLLREALASNPSPVRRLALLREAQELAADARDRALAVKAADAVSFYFEVDPLKEKLHALSAAAWPDDEEATARQLLEEWLGLSATAVQSNQLDVAQESARRAVGVARHWGDEQWVATAEAQLGKVDEARERAGRLEVAAKTLSSHPDDPQANLLVGCDLAARGDWAKALPMLRQSADPVIRLVATRDLAAPAKPDAQVNVAEAWAGASQRQPADVREAFGKRARHWYAQAIQALSVDDRSAIERRMRALPGGTVFDAAMLGASAPARIDPRGGPGGGPFTDLPARGALLVGFRISTGPVFGNPCVCALQPIFRSESGRLEGDIHGQKQGEFKSIEAKPGYAVAGIIVKTGLAVDGFKIVFMRINGSALDPNDKYESPWIGGRGGSPETPLACDGKLVIGIQGRSGEGLDAIGLLQSP